MKNTNTFAKLSRIANKCREVKGWKPGAGLSARSAKDNSGSLFIYSVIGSSWFEEGVTATGVKDALAAMKGVTTLNVFINSEGGDVFEAKTIYTQLKRFAADNSAEIIVHIDGLAASAATFIAMAGDKIITSPAATWMVHEAWTLAMGNASDLRDSADLLDMMNEDIANIYATRTKRSVEEMRDLMSKETWMNAEQALKEKFTDEIASYNEEDEDEDEKSKARSTNKLEAAALTTRQRLSAMTSDLLNFRAKRTAAESNQSKPAQQEMKNKSRERDSKGPPERRP